MEELIWLLSEDIFYNKMNRVYVHFMNIMNNLRLKA